MKTRFMFFLIFLLVFTVSIYGQRYCGSAMNIQEIQQTDTARYQRIMTLENQIQSYQNNVTLGGQKSATTIIIPVVVHVVYYNSIQNISDAQINSQIQVLNEDFQRLNADKTNTPSAFIGVAEDPNIVFKLAKIDPNGNPTTGITRTSTTINGFEGNSNSTNHNNVKYNSMGGRDAWNTQRYLNIWVCNFSDSRLMGYAQFPSDLLVKPNTDGVVISYMYFGRDGGTISPYNKGRTATHEVGHWLNLRHIWGDANNCATDYVNDTPNQYTATFGCPSYPKKDACSSSNPGIMFMNFMDYSDDGCMNLFTAGQAVRMHALFDPQTGIRRQMLEMAEYLTIGCTGITNFTNQTVNTNQTITGCNINVQNVTVTNNSKLILDAVNETTITKDFEVPIGSELEIR